MLVAFFFGSHDVLVLMLMRCSSQGFRRHGRFSGVFPSFFKFIFGLYVSIFHESIEHDVIGRIVHQPAQNNSALLSGFKHGHATRVGFVLVLIE